MATQVAKAVRATRSFTFKGSLSLVVAELHSFR